MPDDTPKPERNRLAFDLSKPIAEVVDHVATVMGTSRAQIALTALSEALPGLLERADLVEKRAAALTQSKLKQSRK